MVPKPNDEELRRSFLELLVGYAAWNRLFARLDSAPIAAMPDALRSAFARRQREHATRLTLREGELIDIYPQAMTLFAQDQPPSAALREAADKAQRDEAGTGPAETSPPIIVAAVEFARRIIAEWRRSDEPANRRAAEAIEPSSILHAAADSARWIETEHLGANPEA